MTARIRVVVEKPDVPPGSILLEDVGFLAQGLHDSLARLVHRQLGFPARTRLRPEARQLVSIVVENILEGSGVLDCAVLPVRDASGRSPASIAAFDLVQGIRSFQGTSLWPAYLPHAVRTRMGAAVAPVIAATGDVRIEVSDNGASAACTIDPTLRNALQAPERFSVSEPIQIVGDIFDINIGTRSFRVEAARRKITVRFQSDSFSDVDSLRWKRVFAAGYPEDERCHCIGELTALRAASADEQEGVTLPREVSRAEQTEAYAAVASRVDDLLALPGSWDSYSGNRPTEQLVRWALDFLRDAVGVLLDFGIDPPIPFFVPTVSGGVQFEWSLDDRELELEVPQIEVFQYLATTPRMEKEGGASRWEAIRWLRWVATGEQA